MIVVIRFILIYLILGTIAAMITEYSITNYMDKEAEIYNKKPVEKFRRKVLLYVTLIWPLYTIMCIKVIFIDMASEEELNDSRKDIILDNDVYEDES